MENPAPITPQTIRAELDNARSRQLHESIQQIDRSIVIRALGTDRSGWLVLHGSMAYKWGLGDEALDAMAHQNPETVAYMASLVDPQYYTWEVSTFCNDLILTIRERGEARPCRDYWAELKAWFTGCTGDIGYTGL